MTKTQQIINRRDAHMCINYPRYPIAMERGLGCSLWDADGKQYLDLFAGFGATMLGHCHPGVVEAVKQQADQLWHVGNLFHNEPQTRVAQSIATLGFGGRSFFCHSGADANEAAFKLARLYGKANPRNAVPGAVPGAGAGGRYEIISTTHSFHGRSFGTMVATGQAKVSQGFEPLMPGYKQVAYNDITAIKQAINDKTIAIIVEPIQGEGGVIVPDDSYLPALRQLCDEQDLLLICDEVWVGCGRTGKAFAHQHWNITPDIMTLGKGVGGGLAVGVMCARPEIAKHYDWQVHGGVAHATTLGGNCLSMAASAAVFDTLVNDHLIQQAAQRGQYTMKRLAQIKAKTNAIIDIRGKGLFIGIQLNRPGKEIVNRCMAKGVLLNATQETVLRLAPPLIITEKQLDAGLDVLENVLLDV